MSASLMAFHILLNSFMLDNEKGKASLSLNHLLEIRVIIPLPAHCHLLVDIVTADFTADLVLVSSVFHLNLFIQSDLRTDDA